MGLQTMLIAVTVIIVTATGLFTYHTSVVSSLESDKFELTEQRNLLQAKNNALESTNASLKSELKNKLEESIGVRVELEKYRFIDEQTQQKVIELETKLRGKGYNDRIGNIRNSKKASLLLRFTNKNVKCETKNFTKAGKCVMGTFKPDKTTIQEEKVVADD